MHFGFFLKGDMPDTDGDGDDYLDDYYSISLLDLGALAWHASSTDAFDGNSYWCGDEEVGTSSDKCHIIPGIFSAYTTIHRIINRVNGIN